MRPITFSLCAFMFAASGISADTIDDTHLRPFYPFRGEFVEQSSDEEFAPTHYAGRIIQGTRFLELIQTIHLRDGGATSHIWILAYSYRAKEYLAWLFIPTIENPSPIPYQGVWIPERAQFEFNRTDSIENRWSQIIIKAPTKDHQHPVIIWPAFKKTAE